MAEGARTAKADEAARSVTAPTVRATQAPRATVARAPLDGRRTTLLSPRTIQPALRVSSPGDAAEMEADRVAKAVVAAPDSAPAATQRTAPALHRAAAPAAAGGKKKGAGADPAVEAQVRKAATGGMPLPAKARATLEPRFRANFGGVRIHTDGKARSLATQLGARAFTFGSHIFFNDGQYDPNSKGGLELLAHELTHTIQQGEAIQRKAIDPGETRVAERTPHQASRLGLSDALDFFADAANAIPGYRMFTILLGVNPINMSPVEASAANILRAIVEFLPGGNVITRVLDAYGIFDRIGSWVEGQLKSLGITGASIKAALKAFMDSLSWRDIFDLGGVWNRAKAIFTDPITRIIAFVRSLFSEIMRIVREAVLKPLAALAEGTAGYPLLKAVLGFDPVTGEPVPRTADTVIGGFMTMIGQEELWQNIKKANAISRAWAWFQGALGGLMALVRSIPGRFVAALKSLEIMDFVVLPSAFVKLAATFGGFLADFGKWALGTVLDLLKIIIEVVAPGVMPYLAKAAGAFNTIVRDPVRFVRTLVRAAVQGFRQFASNFLTHLKASLIGWLTGALGGAGIYIPQGFSLMEIVKFVLSVMGLTWANIRVKLVKATNETTVKVLETGFDIVKTLVTQGPAAAWQKIVETLSNLKQMAIDAVMDFVKSKVVDAAVTKLLSMLSPAGALIQAIIAIYNTVMFFVERIKQIAAVAASFIDSIATIAAGNIGPAANRVEKTMAGLLTLVISFLARIAGLGKVSDAVIGLVNKIRAPIDKALDKVVTWIVETAKKLGKMVVGGAKRALFGEDKRTDAEKQRDLDKAVRELKPVVRGLFKKGPPGPLLRARLMVWKLKYKLNDLTLGPSGEIRATINPTALIDQLVPISNQQALNVIRLEVQAFFHRDRDPGVVSAIQATGTGSRDRPYYAGAAGNPTQGIRSMLVQNAARGESTFIVGQHVGTPVTAIIQRPNMPRSPNSGEGFAFNPVTGTRVTIGAYERSGDIPGLVTVAPSSPPRSTAATVLTGPFLGDSSLPAGYMLEMGYQGRISASHSIHAAQAAGSGMVINTMEGVRNPLGAVTIPSSITRTADRGDVGWNRLGQTQGGPQAPAGSAKDWRLAEHAMSRFDPVTGARLSEKDDRFRKDPTPRGVKDPMKPGSELRAAAHMNASVDALSDTILQGMVVNGVVMILSAGDFEIIRIRTREFLRQHHGANP